MLLAAGAEGVGPLPEAAGMADALSMASTCAVCSHTDDAVGYVIPGCVGLFPAGASRTPWVSRREGEEGHAVCQTLMDRSGHAPIVLEPKCHRHGPARPARAEGESFLAQCRDAGACQHAPRALSDACRPMAAKCLRQTRVRVQASSVVHYNGLRRVTCPVPEDDPPIVSVGVAMASP